MEEATVDEDKRRNKERFTLNFRKHPTTSMKKIGDFLEKLNDKRYGKRITLHEVVADCVENHTPRDIKRIRDASLSPMDRIRIKYEDETKNSGNPPNFEDYLAKKLRVD